MSACIDGSDDVYLQSSKLWIVHGSYQFIGQNVACNGHTTVEIDGVSWVPTWTGNTSNTFTAPVPLPAAPGTLQVTPTKARGIVTVVQHPAASNSYTGAIRLDDDALGGAADYEITVSRSCSQ